LKASIDWERRYERYLIGSVEKPENITDGRLGFLPKPRGMAISVDISFREMTYFGGQELIDKFKVATNDRGTVMTKRSRRVKGALYFGYANRVPSRLVRSVETD
jgi:hypothetical protein